VKLITSINRVVLKLVFLPGELMCKWCIRYQKAERLSRVLERACEARDDKVRDCKIQEEKQKR